MTNRVRSGLLVTFEGLAGSGKSTVAARVADWLEAEGLDVVRTREPGGTSLGTDLRSMLLHGPAPDPWAEAFLFEADRAETYSRVILPALERGLMVVSDRNLYGTVAYQGFGRGLDVSLIDAMSAAATGRRPPDQVFLLDVEPEVALARRRDGGASNRFDEEGLDFHRRAREGYLFAARRDGRRARVVNAGQSFEAVVSEVRSVLEALVERPLARGVGV